MDKGVNFVPATGHKARLASFRDFRGTKFLKLWSVGGEKVVLNSILFLTARSGYGYQKVRLRPEGQQGKPRDLLLIRKFARRMKGSKRKIVDGQIFEKAANIGL